MGFKRPQVQLLSLGPGLANKIDVHGSKPVAMRVCGFFEAKFRKEFTVDVQAKKAPKAESPPEKSGW